jgi:hypothetical protein
MNYKPSDLYLGVVDLFGILLPGALACLLFLDIAQRWIFNDSLLPKLHGDVQLVAAFVIGAYLLGLITDAIGSVGLDWLTDRLYRRKKEKAHDSLVARARSIRTAELGGDVQLTSEFRWARASVYARSPEGARAIERLEANAKLFRSVTVVLVVACVKFSVQGLFVAALLSLGVAVLTLSRTAVQRWQRDKTTFEYYVVASLPGPSTTK